MDNIKLWKMQEIWNSFHNQNYLTSMGFFWTHEKQELTSIQILFYKPKSSYFMRETDFIFVHFWMLYAVYWSSFFRLKKIAIFCMNHFRFRCNFQAANVQQVLTQIKGSNQMAQFLGNKVEMAITKAVEGNKTIQRVGLHFEFGDCR